MVSVDLLWHIVAQANGPGLKAPKTTFDSVAEPEELEFPAAQAQREALPRVLENESQAADGPDDDAQSRDDEEEPVVSATPTRPSTRCDVNVPRPTPPERQEESQKGKRPSDSGRSPQASSNASARHPPKSDASPESSSDESEDLPDSLSGILAFRSSTSTLVPQLTTCIFPSSYRTILMPKACSAPPRPQSSEKGAKSPKKAVQPQRSHATRGGRVTAVRPSPRLGPSRTTAPEKEATPEPPPPVLGKRVRKKTARAQGLSP